MGKIWNKLSERLLYSEGQFIDKNKTTVNTNKAQKKRRNYKKIFIITGICALALYGAYVVVDIIIYNKVEAEIARKEELKRKYPTDPVLESYIKYSAGSVL